ncbi:MAG TPA: YHYH protein [Candidatus Baltobacteraceae bacterium]|nr:YHYH protein [Candidatus Baltobacteraceae bacterium]
MKQTLSWISVIAAIGILADCSGGSSLPSSNAAIGSAADAATLANARATVASANRSKVDLAALPIGDNRYTTSGPKKMWVYSCQSSFRAGGAPSQSLPWVNAGATTWDYAKKLAVEGAVSWTSSMTSGIAGTQRTIDTNGLPDHVTGIFPIAAADPAYQYDRNPNAIEAQSLSYAISANPRIAQKPSCLNMGPIGIMNTGAALFNALDAAGRDAAVHEVLDSCWGHPQMQGMYHYHTYSSCMGDSSTGHSKLLGYALDGFGIFGPRGENGKVLTSKQLDQCHGHTHVITWNGKRVKMYHYHFTYDFPYSLGCFRGTP